MVRETRHLWVGNLPENIREDRIRDHFKRYGRVQSVKLLPRAKDDEGSGACATVSFMDIKSASKAHNIEQKLEDRTLSTEYHEPAAIPGSGAPIYSSQRFSHGPPEEISSFERSSHFYERERDRRDGDVYLRRTSSTYHVPAAEPLRGRTRDRHYRNGPYAPVIESVVSRQPAHHRSVGSSWSYDTPSRYPPPAATPDIYTDDRRDMTPVVVVHKKHAKSRSGSNGSESGSNSGSSVSRSRSSSSSSQSGSSSCSSASSSPVSDKSCSTHSHHGSLRSGVTLQSAVSTPHTNNSSPAVHSDDRRPLAICVRNLPARSSDTSLKDGLFHEYKKHGKVTWVKVVGQGSDRYALVCFKKPEDVEKALQVSHDKLFFGCKIEVAPYQGYDVDDNEFRFVARPYEAEQDEFHPKATRTLFIGNLEKDITAPELRKHFDQFGEIIEIDIKKQGSNSSYAFCQYCDIGSVVRAMRTLDGEHLGNNRIKLGFGKSLHTNVVWVDGVAETVTEKYLSLQFSQFGSISHVAIDRSRGHALVFFDQIAFAQSAVKEMRGVALRGRKLQVDFASRECQEAFYDHMEKQTGHTNTFDNSIQVSPLGVTSSVTRGFETPSSSSSSSGGGTSRFPRYSTQPSVTRSYSRGTTNNAASPSASPSTPARSTPRHITSTPRFDFSSTDYIPERRPYRSYEEMSMEDGGGMVTVTVGQGPQDIRHLQKERVALLEQLEDCASSGEEGSSRRRCKHRRSHSGEGSRPGTPLCDERPENLPPVEPRRTPRERPPDPLSLPLPRFATQLMSPRPAPPSPPASPPRPQSSSSDDSEPSPPSPEWEERLRSLDEKYEKWSGSRSIVKVDPTTLRVRHKLLDLDVHELQPSDIVKSVLARRSVFDEDSKRLENFGEKYEPREFVPTRPGFTTLRPRIDSPLLHSPAAPKSPAAGSSPAGAKGLQYPFPSHPPVQPTTSVATTTAAMSMASCSSLSSGITTVSSNICPIDTSKSPQTFPTTCISSVSSVRQFQPPTSTFQPPPKISSLSTLEKKSDSVDTIARVSCSDKLKSCQKPLPTTPSTEKSDVLKKDTSSAVQTLLKPLKSCLVRRESGDERRDADGRRRSREEDAKSTCISKSESEKLKDVESLDRRRSCSDPRRRDSVDSNKDSSRSESVSDKLKDRNYKEERRRRDSVDISARKDTDVIDTFKSKLSDSIVSEHSDLIECSKLTDSLNCNKINDTRLDDNLRHIQPTDTSEKKKDSIQVCPERDRRRARDSVDSCSDNSRHRKVPESLDNKRELESDTRQKDNTDKSECSFKKSLEYIERRKDSGHTEISKPIDLFDRRREKDGDVNQENTRHKEKKDQISRKDKEGIDLFENPKHKTASRKSPNAIENLKYKDDKSKISNPEGTRQRESNMKESESTNEQSQRCGETKPEDVFHSIIKHRELVESKDLHMSNCVTELEDSSDNELQHKEIKKENESYSLSRHKDKHHDYSKIKEGDNKKSSFVESAHNKLHLGLLKDENFDSNKQISQEHENNPDVHRHSVQSSYEYPSHRFKDYTRRKDEEKVDVKSKNVFKNLNNDIIENCRLKYSEKQRENETTNQISEWVEEIRKDLESSGYGKSRPENEFNQLEPESKSNIIMNADIYHGKKKNDNDLKDELKKEEKFNSLLKESGKTKLFESAECNNYERRKSNDTSDTFQRKETSDKRDYNNFDSLNSNDLDRRRVENDFSDSLKHNALERKKDSYDRNIHKESAEYINESRHKDWLGNKYADRKPPNFEKDRKSNRDFDYSDKEESNINDKQKDDGEMYDTNFNDSIEHLDDDNGRKNDCLKKDKKKDRLNSWPAVIGCKRRLSSQDSLDVYADDSKKNRPERRDSKDSGRSSSSSSTVTVSKKGTTEKHIKSYTKLLEDKIKEDKEKEIIQKRKEDEIIDKVKAISRKEKRNSGEKRKEDRKGKSRPKENGITASESEAGSGDDESKTPKRHSIFDIVDEEPAYISMYDKVKARSTKNMQKQEEEKRQERLKEKFNQLKQSRAKREEKKRSTSYDEDSDSERGGRRSNKLMITSSEEDAGSEGDVRTKGRKIMSDTSEDDSHKHQRLSNVKPLRFNSEDVDNKARKIMSDTSEDDTHKMNISRVKVSRNQPEDLEPKLRKILSDTSEDDIMKHNISRNKPSRIQSDESEVDLLFEDNKKRGDYVKKSNNYAGSDVYSNISEDPIHPTNTDTEKEINENRRTSVDSNPSEQPRKKSHKKKQKRQKNGEDNEDGGSKRHSSKKDRRKSSHSHDGDEDQLAQSKIRKKKSERENSSKRGENMEEIFGPMSDDSDNIHNKWQVSQIYGSDSDEEKQIMRKRDKRRKERKARELLEAGNAIEAKLLDNSVNYPTEEFTKTKKKKRKKSRDEKTSKHHQQRLEEEAAAVANEADSEREPEPIIPSPSLPRLMDSPPSCLSQNKKPDIPGFGSQVDENIHETAVKSISESPTKPVEEKPEPIDEPMPASTSEDKPTPVISQEETEDAVAALLLEDSFGGGSFESYSKADTPVSEPDLQIDTDTEDAYDPIDFSRPPRTPDIPTSFYRQQDTREGLEERILPLACPDSSSNKDNEQSGKSTSPLTVGLNDSNRSEEENKLLVKSSSKTDLSCRIESDKNDKAEEKSTHDSSADQSFENSSAPVEGVKKHDLPPLVCQTELSHVQAIKVTYSEKQQLVPEPNLPNLSNVKFVNVEKPIVPKGLLSTTSSSSTVVDTKTTIGKITSNELQPQFNVTLSSSSQTEYGKPSQTDIVSTTQHDYSRSKIIYTQSSLQEGNPDKSQIKTNATVSKIIVSPPTSVALIVQTQPKIGQTNQQNNSVVQLTTKLHSPVSQKVDLKSNAQLPQYVLHHTLQPTQILANQPPSNKANNQQSGPSSQGTQGQVNQTNIKLSVPTLPVSAKSPGLPTSSKSPGLPLPPKPSQDQPFKQLVINNPHSQQLSVNVSHHHINANVLLSPNQQMAANHSTTGHHSPATLSFSPHHIKVSLAQQAPVHPGSLQLSPNVHQHIGPLSPHQKSVQQHSPASQQSLTPHLVASQYPNKSNSPLLQPATNCIGSPPVKLSSPTKPATLHTIRHTSPAPLACQINKLSAHVLQPTPVQQVRAVVLQNPVKQTVTLLQQQMGQKPQMIRPVNAPQPQVVHTLKSDPPLTEKNKVTENTTSTIVKNELNLAHKQIRRSSEDLLSMPTVKKDDIHMPTKLDKGVENKNELMNQTINTERHIVKPLVEELKPLNAVIQDLTHKAAQAKQQISNLSNNVEESKSDVLKPLDQVVQEIHDKIKASVPSKLAKTVDPPTKVEQNKIISESDVKTEPKESTLDVVNRNLEGDKFAKTAKDEVKDLKEVMKNDDISNAEQEENREQSKSLEVKTEVNKSDPVIKHTEQPKVEKIRIVKKEENGLCVDAAPSSSSEGENPSTQVKNESKVDDASNNPDVPINKSEEYKSQQPETKEEPSATPTRGRGGRRRKASGRAGGVLTRRARLNNSAASSNDMSSGDVYEFRDDSEEEANRPRLILTIKSPPEPATSLAQPVPPPVSAPSTCVSATTTSTATVTAPATTTTTSQANNSSTRKSRRLQEKDGSRNTVDDTIEDVIRGTRGGSRRTTRASANYIPPPTPPPTLETRKSPRRKQSTQSNPLPLIASAASELKPAVDTSEEPLPSSPQQPLPPPQTQPQPQSDAPAEPMTLIDPVTGLLIPMRESEEGQYIPVNADHVRPALDNKEDSGEPAEKRMRTTLPTEVESSLPMRPGIPVKVPPNCAVVPPLPPKTMSMDLSRPITKTTGIVVPSGIPRPTCSLPVPVAINKPLTINAPSSLVKGVMMSPTGGHNSKATVTNVVGPLTINNRVAASPALSPSSKPVAPTISTNTPLNHKTHLLQAVANRGKVPVAKVPTPMAPKAHILHSMSNVVGREGMVLPGTPPPPHHGVLLTGSVASPPLRAPHHASQQPVVTGASTRVVCKGMLDPVKVEPASCIVVPSATPQSRSQVMQAGLPVPAYEASIHGLVAELLPNPQWPRQSPPPAHQSQGDVVQHVNFPPHHLQPAHYVHHSSLPAPLYHQYLREAALTSPYHIPAGVKSELEEAVTGGSPPLELRRGSPHDRATDSPTVYVHGNRHVYYEPPPAHRPSQPRLQVTTPPHASQVPPQADSLLMLLQRYPVMWQGLLALKTDQAAVQMHFVFGNPHVARDSLPCNSDGSTPPLRIAQRMRLEQTQVEGVARKMQMDNEHCMLLALPCGRDHMDVLQQSNNLQSGFITYLQQKQAAGIINIAGPGSQQAAYVVHIFPSCDFANESLARIAPDLLHRVANIAHLLIVIATV